MDSRKLDLTFDWRLGMMTGLVMVLLALCVAGSAQAEPRLYSGSLIIHAFGNDTSTGATPPFDDPFAVGIPLTGQCNTEPYHAKETLAFPTATPTFTFTIPAYGGAVNSCVQTASGFATSAACTGTTMTNTVNPCTIPCGCGDATVQAGDPMLASGAIVTTGLASTARATTDPRAFTIPQSAFTKVKSGASFERYGVYQWEVHFADLANEAANFSKGGGDGSFGPIDPSKAAKQKRAVTQTAGKNQFGGTMQLLGTYGDNEGYFNATAGVTSVFYYNWLFNYMGADGQATKAGVVTRGYVYGPYAAYGYTRISGGAYTSYAEIEVFKWTTGTVTVTAVGGTFPTVLQRKGYDNRTAMGSGAVQLVSPMLSQWEGATSGTASATAGVGILKLTFTPEPSEWMLLAGGVSMLGLLVYHRSRC